MNLSDFISQKMRMSHIYQPVMLMELPRRGGRASADEIAKTEGGAESPRLVTTANVFSR
jgi:hypothetical protein